MATSALIHFADFVQLLTIGITLSGYIPQLVRLYRTRSSAGLSVSTWTLWTVGNGMALFYGVVHYLVDHCCLPVVLTTGLNFVLCLGTCALIVLLRIEGSRELPSSEDTKTYRQAVIADVRV